MPFFGQKSQKIVIITSIPGMKQIWFVVVFIFGKNKINQILKNNGLTKKRPFHSSNLVEKVKLEEERKNIFVIFRLFEISVATSPL
jgi:hypothetical protein